MDEMVEEELQIQEERAKARHISDAAFTRTIGEICERPANTLDITASIGDAIRSMRERRIGNVIITKDGKLHGIVTERDLMLKVAGNIQDVELLPVTGIMTPDPECLMKRDTIAHLLNKMYIGGFRHMPIVDEEHRPLHTVSLRYILQYIIAYLPDDIVNMPSEPFRGEASRYGG